MWLPTRQLAWVCCLRLNADQTEAMSTSLSLNQQQLEIVMLWARDEDVPARSIRLVVELVRRNLQVQFLCGTRQCLRALAAQSIAAHALRVPALWRASGALAPIANQQELAKMKLRLPGVRRCDYDADSLGRTGTTSPAIEVCPRVLGPTRCPSRRR